MRKPTIESAAVDLVRAIYDEPDIPDHPVLLAGLSNTKRMAFKNGYYSVRDLPEFKKFVAFLKKAGIYV